MTDLPSRIDAFAEHLNESLKQQLDWTIQSCLQLADNNKQLRADKAELLEGLRKADEWLSGWGSAEPYLGIIRDLITKHSGAGETG